MPIRVGSGIVCPRCKRRLGSLARYCNQCGSKLPPPLIPVDPDERFQADQEVNLGEDGIGLSGDMGHVTQAVTVGAKFCLVCGKEFHFVE